MERVESHGVEIFSSSKERCVDPHLLRAGHELNDLNAVVPSGRDGGDFIAENETAVVVVDGGEADGDLVLANTGNDDDSGDCADVVIGGCGRSHGGWEEVSPASHVGANECVERRNVGTGGDFVPRFLLAAGVRTPDLRKKLHHRSHSELRDGARV